MPNLLAILNTALPAVLALYKELRDRTPDQPSLTDEQIIDLLALRADRIVAQAEEWLASHPPQDE